MRGARGVRGILGMPGTRGVRSILSMGVRVSRIFFSFFFARVCGMRQRIAKRARRCGSCGDDVDVTVPVSCDWWVCGHCHQLELHQLPAGK